MLYTHICTHVLRMPHARYHIAIAAEARAAELLDAEEFLSAEAQLGLTAGGSA